MTLEQIRTALADFLESNKKSFVEPFSDDDDTVHVKSPWGEDSISLPMPTNKSDRDNLIASLNAVLLPERFTAIWHKDTKDLEIVYTAFPLIGTQSEIWGRSFSFSFRGTDYKCGFGRSSDRLLTIAEHSLQISPSNTDHRNLVSFQYYIDAEKNRRGAMKMDGARPVSFWVRNFVWEEDSAVDLARHLNFYMSYYDMFSPRIEIHPPKASEEYKSRERYIAGSFPHSIKGADLNSNIMHYWAASRGGDAFRRFLYAFQVLEFASFHYVEDNVRRAVKKALSTPHILDEMDNIIIEIIDHVQESKLWDGTKMDSLLERVVDSKLIWREVKKNKDYFCKPVQFEGGFVLKSFIVEKTTEDVFAHDWHKKFNQSIRTIRNALSHGKEQSMSSIITPTHQNFLTIQPWGQLISIAAGEVAVYYKSAM